MKVGLEDEVGDQDQGQRAPQTRQRHKHHLAQLEGWRKGGEGGYYEGEIGMAWCESRRKDKG